MKALSRSLRIYHGDKERHAAMDRLYGAFLSPGDLAFDIGAHVGDRISSFRRLGARVVALEPQPGPARVIRLIHRRDPLVTLVEAACGDHEGSIALRINSENPTVSTASAALPSPIRLAARSRSASVSRSFRIRSSRMRACSKGQLFASRAWAERPRREGFWIEVSDICAA